MDAKAILAIVQDMGTWRGDVYKLAYAVAEAAEAAQRETDAQLAESMGELEAGRAIRGI